MIGKVVLCALFAASATATEPAKKPVPDAKAQGAATELIKDLFKSEYATKAADKRAEFAKTLLKQGQETKEDAGAQFVLLREAQDVAASAGDVETALAAIDEMNAVFAIDPVKELSDMLGRLIAAAKDPAGQRAIAGKCSEMVDAALSADNFDRAAAMVALAERAALKARDIPTVTSVRKRKEEVASARTKFAKYAKFVDTLAKSPDDPEANLEMGKFACFIKGDWDVGLPRLAKGGDAALKALAARSLAKPTEGKDIADLAASWWDVGEKLVGAERQNVREHAAEWYRAAAPDLVGLGKTVAERRIAEAEKGAPKTGPSGRRTIDLIKLIDPTKDAIHGKWVVDKAGLQCESGGLVPKLQIPYQPPAEYDLTITFLQPRLRNPVGLTMPNRNGGAFYWGVGGERGELILSAENDAVRKRVNGCIRANTKHTTMVQVRKDSVTTFLDGKMVYRHKTDFKDLSSDGWHDLKDKTLLGVFCDDPTTYYTVQLVEITGTGKRTR